MRVRRDWTEDEDNKLQKIFFEKQKEEITQELGRTWTSIKARAHNLGLKRKRMIKCKMKPGTNHYFFDNWSSDMTYVLGFIAADGCIARSKKYLKIKLGAKDRKHLEKIKTLLSPGNEIKEEIKVHPKTKKILKYVKLVVCSTYICKRLIVLGIMPRKTFILEFPDIPGKYMADFVRGYFDGDGCICKDSNKNAWESSFLGTKMFLSKLNEIISDNIGATLKNLVACHNGKTYKLKYAMYDSMELYKWMYSIDDSLFLKRKRNNFEQLIKERGGKPFRKHRLFTKEEDEYIKNNFNIKTYYEISDSLNRSYNVVRKRAATLGLRKMKERK